MLAPRTHQLERSPRPPRATLLVFTLGPEAEVRRRQLLPTPLGDREAALHRACLEEALAAGRGAGCRLEVSSPPGSRLEALPPDAAGVAQRGECFGERFAHAFDAAAARSSVPVVAVGTDTPGLREEHVTRAVALLREGGDDRVVIGPSPDGGFYLLAANRPLGDLLTGVRWCRRTTLAHLRRLLHRAGLAVALLEPLADLDQRTDLEGWLARLPLARDLHGATVRLATAIARALAALRRPSTPSVLGRPRLIPAPVPRGRAPPSHR
ncbi:MAG: DUF2064 domain-containing protein [Acidobacteriota bacterium]|jgi:glycosyltransferase A (GT-A) superfamily protein (DUF2064 family)